MSITVKEFVNRCVKAGVRTPIELDLELYKLVRSNQSRYFKVYVHTPQGRMDVTKEVAAIENLKISNARDARGCLIIHGCGMDMAEGIQLRLQQAAFAEHIGNIVDNKYYDAKVMFKSR